VTVPKGRPSVSGIPGRIDQKPEALVINITRKRKRLDALAGGPPGDRTRDTLIKSQVLYH
jgi:hypothetical protein